MMQSIRCGTVTLFVDVGHLARGGKAKLRVSHPNGEATDVEVLAFDLFGVLQKFASELNQTLDMLQREMEKAQA